MKITDYQRDLPKLNRELADLADLKQRVSSLERTVAKLQRASNSVSVPICTWGPIANAQGLFTTTGGDVIVVCSGSGYTSGVSMMGFDIYIDGVWWASSQVYSNETTEHRAVVTDIEKPRSLAAGNHKIVFQAKAGFLSDGNDCYYALVIEQPR